MSRFRRRGWKPNELKIYWNSQQLEDLCPKSLAENQQVKEENDQKQSTQKSDNNNASNDLPPHDPSDKDAVLALREYPVSKRNYKCQIEFIHNGIEKAVFQAPKDAQLIVLNFAVSFRFSSRISFFRIVLLE